MKISRIKLENFKRFRSMEIQVRNNLTQDISDQFLILGDNGTGKTTVLQAVALCLALLSGKTRQVSEFDWHGWVPGRYEKWGTPVVELDVQFSGDEIDATQEAAKLWYDNRKSQPEENVFLHPGNSQMVTVRLEGRHYFVVGGARENLYQFRGRMYASQILGSVPRVRDLFSRLPGVFWFDQFRNLASPPPDLDDTSRTDLSLDNGKWPQLASHHYSIGTARMRKYLIDWWMTRLTGGGGTTDWLLDLENSYKRVFPGRSFSIPEPLFVDGIPTPKGHYFILADGNRTYDIEEMSAGEQSVFPMLYEFVRMQIRNSVVLIDEVDLNLHPPLAQSLLVALPSIGPNCQFLLTTHSEAISSLASNEETYRLQGGRLCL